MRVWAYENLDLPEGARLFDAEQYFSRNEIHRFRQNGITGSPAIISNVFRYRLLAGEAGWWFDMDCICLKEQSEFQALKKSRRIIAGWEDSSYVNSGVLSFADIATASKLLNFFNAVALANSNSFSWGDAGPKLLTKFIVSNDLAGDICPVTHFYPLHHSEAIVSLDPQSFEYVGARCSGSFLFHYYNEIFRRQSVDKSLLPPSGSYLRQLFTANGFCLTADSVADRNVSDGQMRGIPADTAVSIVRDKKRKVVWRSFPDEIIDRIRKFEFGLRNKKTSVSNTGNEYATLSQSGLFDADYYLNKYPDVLRSGMDPIVHYLNFGAKEMRKPCSLFDTAWYLDTYPDVASAQINPLVHYVIFGAGEGRRPHPLFDVDCFVSSIAHDGSDDRQVQLARYIRVAGKVDVWPFNLLIRCPGFLRLENMARFDEYLERMTNAS
ncbi:MAG TPA: hypothetical protein VN371_08120 [Chlorobaculum sp.]|nr:hypothetical protein [Chlorobaculum sp.]